MAAETRIPTPWPVRWRRVQFQLLPLLTVVLCSLLAWRLWREAPRGSTVGQVSVVSRKARSTVAGVLLAPADGEPAVFARVAAGQVVAKVQEAGGGTHDIVAPCGGRVVEIRRGPGEAVAAGEAVLTVTADNGRYITAFVRADQRFQPEPGTAVDVRLRTDPTKSYRSFVKAVGPQYEPIPPPHARAGRKSDEEWGLPVMIAIPEEAAVRPGELVDVGWRSERVEGVKTDAVSDSSDDED